MAENLKRAIPPEHPGIILRELYVEPLALSNADLAGNLGVTRVTVNRLLNGRQAITAEMALRLSSAFGTSPELWLNLQQEYDLWKASQHLAAILKPIRLYDKIHSA